MRKPKCFVIIQIGKEDSDERLKSDRVMKYIVERALEDKYHVQRADDIRQPGTVTVQIIEQLLEAPLVVADLSDRNANVYYELAIRHAVKKPVVHLITKGQEAPFDVNQMRYVSYDITAPESVEAAREELKQNVEAIEKEGGQGLLTPIQFTQFVLAAQKGQGGNRDTALIMNAFGAAMSNISAELRTIKEFLESSVRPYGAPTWAGFAGSGKTHTWGDALQKVLSDPNFMQKAAQEAAAKVTAGQQLADLNEALKAGAKTLEEAAELNKKK